MKEKIMGHVNIWNLTGPGGEWGARVVLCPNDVHGNVPDETVHLLSDKVQQLPIHPSEQHIDSNSQNTHKTPECVNCVCGGGGCMCKCIHPGACTHLHDEQMLEEEVGCPLPPSPLRSSDTVFY